jgi:hypothetical protein
VRQPISKKATRPFLTCVAAKLFSPSSYRVHLLAELRNRAVEEDRPAGRPGQRTGESTGGYQD